MMSDDSGQVNPSSHSEPESKRGDSQRAGFAGKRLAALLKAVALLAFVTAGLLHFAGRISAQSDQGANRMGGAQRGDAFDSQISGNAQRMMEEGRRIFRFDTFGDEVFWTYTLKLHRAIEGEKLGGVGPGVSPKTALSVGLKVDMDALPADLVAKIKGGQVNLDDPATTLALIKLNSVLGLKGTFNIDGCLNPVGLTCAVCHSTVDDAFAPGIGHRLDGWSNQDLNVGAKASLAPDLSAL